jgi:hypothetical protein
MKLKPFVLLAALAALLMPAATASAAQPGINIAGAPTPDRIQEALATGAKSVRIFALWKDFEPNARGEYPSSNHNLANTVKVYDDAIRALNAGGAQPVFVMTEAPVWASGSSDPFVPPVNPADFADFLKRFAAHNKGVGTVAGYEVWNEADENSYWHPAPNAATYAAMLKAAYPAIKQGDPNARVIAAPTTGNNYDWMEQLYANGVQGSFDVAAVHTDTACSVDGPDTFYRDSGRLARFTFLGYRSVRETMLAHGDDKPIWMTELGWSSTNGGPTSCTRGRWAGQKASGVTEALQAAYLTKAYACLANDPYVEQASWFTLRDTTGSGVDEFDHYGIVNTAGAPKPSWAAFRQVAVAGGGAAGSCGDFDGPSIRIVRPAPGTQFVDKLDVQAAASDGGVGLARITFNYDGANEIRNFTDSLLNDAPVGLAPWQGSGKLGFGKHTITVLALDKNGNTSTASVEVEKVTKAKLAATLTPAFKLATKKVRCKRGICKLKGRLLRGAPGSPSIGGKVAIEWQFRNAKGKWRKLSGGLKPAHKAFWFQAKLKQKGKWRVRVVYKGQAPWKPTASKYLFFKVK